MLDKEKLDIVTVSPRWLDCHYDMILAAFEHGCHVYTEKPLCRTLEEADELVRAAEMRHLKLAIAHTTRHSPALPIVKKLIDDGELGEVLEIRARGKEDRRGGGEDLWVLGTHALDMMRALGGDVESCLAHVMVEGRPVVKTDVYDGNEGIGPLAGDAVNAMYQLKNGITGFFASRRNQAGEPSRFGVMIYGSRGVIEMLFGQRQTVYWLPASSWLTRRTGTQWVPISGKGVGSQESNEEAVAAANVVAVNDLIDAIEGDRQPKCSLYDARAATEMIVSVFESHRVGGLVKFPLENRKNPLTMLK
jgi:predicted dehydrogenase